MIIHKNYKTYCVLFFWFFNLSVTGVCGFAILPSRRSNCNPILFLVTEDDVLKAVEDAEKLWAEALEARKTANALSDRAEEEAEAASSQAKEVEEIMKDRSQPISVEKLAQADAVARSNLDAGSMVNRALQASDEADRLLAKAELALQQSEECLDQHLKDFPDSPLAQES